MEGIRFSQGFRYIFLLYDYPKYEDDGVEGHVDRPFTISVHVP